MLRDETFPSFEGGHKSNDYENLKCLCVRGILAAVRSEGHHQRFLCEFSLSCGETETFSFITEDTFIRHLGSLIATIFKRFNF